jgi:DNA-binding LytR/AlgR family response regulator
MPEISGIDFMKSLQNSGILVVFTTAYTEYAVDAFTLDALDYLLKPVSFDRFKRSVDRAEEYFSIKDKTEQPQAEMNDGFMFVKADSKMIKINYDEIWYVEAFADYVKIYISEDKRIVTLQTMKNMEQSLPANKFARVHRSYIVATNKVLAIGAHEVKVGNKNIPLGKNYKDAFAQRMQIK